MISRKIILSVLSFLYLSICISCDSKKDTMDNKQIESNENVLLLLENYSFSESKPSALNNHEFPSLPKLDSTQTNKLFEAYERKPEKTSQIITLVFLRYYRASLICCGKGFDLTVSETELDSIKAPLLYLYLNFSNQYNSEALYNGIGGWNPYEWTKKNKKWTEFDLIKKEILIIEKLEKERWEQQIKELLLDVDKDENDKILIDRMIEEGKINGWKIPNF